jgi:hypothetical protein
MAVGDTYFLRRSYLQLLRSYRRFKVYKQQMPACVYTSTETWHYVVKWISGTWIIVTRIRSCIDHRGQYRGRRDFRTQHHLISFYGDNERDDLQDRITHERGTPALDLRAAAYIREHPNMIQRAPNSCLERERLCIRRWAARDKKGLAQSLR